MHNIRENDEVFEFLAQNPLYVVLFVVLIVWIGIYLYLFKIERRIKRLEGQRGQNT